MRTVLLVVAILGVAEPAFARPWSARGAEKVDLLETLKEINGIQRQRQDLRRSTPWRLNRRIRSYWEARGLENTLRRADPAALVSATLDELAIDKWVTLRTGSSATNPIARLVDLDRLSDDIVDRRYRLADRVQAVDFLASQAPPTFLRIGVPLEESVEARLRSTQAHLHRTVADLERSESALLDQMRVVFAPLVSQRGLAAGDAAMRQLARHLRSLAIPLEDPAQIPTALSQRTSDFLKHLKEAGRSLSWKTKTKKASELAEQLTRTVESRQLLKQLGLMTPALDRELRRVHSLLLRNSSTLARLKAKYEEEEEDDDRRRRRRDAELWGDDDWD